MVFNLLPLNARGTALFDSLRREMDQFLHPGEGNERGACFTPRANLAETEKEYELTLDLPGLKPEDFQVELKEGQLWITGERKWETEEKGKTFHRIEREVGQFRRVVMLGKDVDAEKVEASYQNGVLRIVVPKAEQILPRRIEVKG